MVRLTLFISDLIILTRFKEFFEGFELIAEIKVKYASFDMMVIKHFHGSFQSL